MQNIFTKIFLMGINASWIILAVMLFRLLFRKAPKWIICFLWIITGIKLVCPFTIESPISLVPSLPGILSVNSGGTSIKNSNNIIFKQAASKFSTNSTKPTTNNYRQQEEHTQTDTRRKVSNTKNWHINLEIKIINILTIIWIAGIIIMLSYLFISNIHIRKSLCTATHLSGNIYESEFVNSPFILGLTKPRIYIPYNIDNRQLVYILAHENAHIKRKDHILKILAFIVLSIYWFHPLVWISYIFLCRDIEFACDEKAVLLMNAQEKKEYLFTLLNCSTGKNNIMVSPLSFGETRIKERVIRVKKFKKPSFILTAVVFLAGIIISACFLVNPKEQRAEGNIAEPLGKKNELSNFYTAKREQGSDIDVTDAVLPTISFDTKKKTFCFTYDMLSSYMPYGSYTEENNKIILNTDDGQFHYTFKKDSKNTLSFIADASSPVKLADSRLGMEIKDGTIFEPSSQDILNTSDNSTILEAMPASVDLKENTGADGIILYYADTEKIIFGGYFGLFVHDKGSCQIIQSLDLEYIGCNYTQGDNYCSIAASKDGTKVYMQPMRQNKLYIFDTLSGTLEIKDYSKGHSIWDDGSLDLFNRNTEYTTCAIYNDGKRNKICMLHESGNGTIGGCTYSEYTGNNPENYKEGTNYPLFPEN